MRLNFRKFHYLLKGWAEEWGLDDETGTSGGAPLTAADIMSW